MQVSKREARVLTPLPVIPPKRSVVGNLPLVRAIRTGLQNPVPSVLTLTCHFPEALPIAIGRGICNW